MSDGYVLGQDLRLREDADARTAPAEIEKDCRTVEIAEGRLKDRQS